MAGKKGMRSYGRALKERAVHLFLEERWTYQAIARELEIPDPDRVKKWVQAYRREGVLAFTKPKGRPHRPAAPPDELAQLRMENELLKKYHSELRKLQLAKRNIG